MELVNNEILEEHTLSKRRVELKSYYNGYEERQKDLRDMRPSCQTDQIETGPTEAHSEEEKLRD